jgi:[ribosomal protein S5]-alanine N-acetyltransferase
VSRSENGYRITRRLELIPATVELCQAETRGSDALGEALGARVPASWPPPVFAPDDVARIRRQLEAGSGGWTLHYVMLREPGRSNGPLDLLGVAGYAGVPSADGAVEIGYAIAEEHQRRGYATEAVEALVAGAFEHPGIRVITAMTYGSLEPSIRVLRKAGFSQVAGDPAAGLLRYERRRDAADGRPVSDS